MTTRKARLQPENITVSFALMPLATAELRGRDCLLEVSLSLERDYLAFGWPQWPEHVGDGNYFEGINCISQHMSTQAIQKDRLLISYNPIAFARAYAFSPTSR